ncbi:hypothetical protein [Halorubellus litoreus]|uniref:Type IV pilin n=1 Tax=Halorubellus litoreus TaxID=755308 RepID=A0ABD5VJP3_9EURY
MERTRLLAGVVLALLVAVAGFAVLGGEPAETLSISNERDGTAVVEVYQVDADATVVLERADGSSTTTQPGDVDSLDDVTTVRVPANTSREAIPIFPNGTATADASQTGSRFVYVVHDGDPDGRTYLAVGLVDCGDANPSANVTITDDDATLEAGPCE